MRSIVEFITESFSKDELYKDYNRASDVTGQEKKDLIAKYGVESKKAQDIKNKILSILKDLRKNKKTFEDQDVLDYQRLYDYSTQKMCDGLKDEPKEFASYIKNYYFERLKSRKLDKYALMTGLSSYRFSNADKDCIRTYQKIAKAADDINPSAEKIDKNKQLEILNNRITELMQDFKVIYLKRIEDYAKAQYKYYSTDSNLQKLIKEYKDAEKAVEKYKEDNNIRWISYRDAKGNALSKVAEKAHDKVSQFKAFTKMYTTEKSYLDKCREDGEKNFANNIAAISERLIKDNLNIDNLSITNVKNDPKFFEMIITDGNKKLYLRSVFAAQFSTKMIPHFRFIITERK